MAARAVDVERRVARALFRAFVREVRRVGPSVVHLTEPLNVSSWGRGAHVTLPAVPELQSTCFPGVDFVGAGSAGIGEFHREDIMRVIRHEFRLPRATATATKASPIDAGFAHLRTLLHLIALSECSTRFVSRSGERAKVAVEVTTMFRTDTFNPRASKGASPPIRMDDDDSDSESDLEEEDGGAGGSGSEDEAAVAYPFAYRVRVTNEGEEEVQVLGRHWIFTEQDASTVEVPRGSPGVVGLCPKISPGQTFQYMSGTIMETPEGTMEGSLQMLATESGDCFDAVISRTQLLVPQQYLPKHKREAKAPAQQRSTSATAAANVAAAAAAVIPASSSSSGTSSRPAGGGMV